MSNPRKPVEASEEPTPGAVLVTATDFTTAANHLLMAGLLADDPSLRDASLSSEEWQSKLEEYGKSVRV